MSMKDLGTTSIRSVGERTARQTTVMLENKTSKMQHDETATLAPKPIYKATIERVTIKPPNTKPVIKQQTISAALSSVTSRYVDATSASGKPYFDKNKPQIVISETPKSDKLVLYDAQYLKWLFDVFYREIKRNNLKEHLNYTKVKNVYLNMLAEIGGVRSKWLNRSMARHYVTHFQNKKYDNQKRFTLDKDDLAYANENVHNLVAQYFDSEERVGAMIPTFSPTTQYDTTRNINTKNSAPNLPLSSISNRVITNTDNDITESDESQIRNKLIFPDRVQSILRDIQSYGGVSRNSGALPTMSYKNISQNGAHKMEEISKTKGAIAQDVSNIFESIFGRNQYNLPNHTASSPSHLTLENLPQEILRLVLNTVKRSK